MSATNSEIKVKPEVTDEDSAGEPNTSRVDKNSPRENALNSNDKEAPTKPIPTLVFTNTKIKSITSERRATGRGGLQEADTEQEQLNHAKGDSDWREILHQGNSDSEEFFDAEPDHIIRDVIKYGGTWSRRRRYHYQYVDQDEDEVYHSACSDNGDNSPQRCHRDYRQAILNTDGRIVPTTFMKENDLVFD